MNGEGGRGRSRPELAVAESSRILLQYAAGLCWRHAPEIFYPSILELRHRGTSMILRHK